MKPSGKLMGISGVTAGTNHIANAVNSLKEHFLLVSIGQTNGLCPRSPPHPSQREGDGNELEVILWSIHPLSR
jgi:hypothetical protein